MTVRETNAQRETRPAVLIAQISLMVASFVAGIFFAGSWLLDDAPSFNPAAVWCDGAYDISFPQAPTAAHESEWEFMCIEDMSDGSADRDPSIKIELP